MRKLVGASALIVSLLTIANAQQRAGSQPATSVALVSDIADLRSFEVGQATSIRIADPDLTDEVRHHLNLIGSAKAMDLRRMTVSATGDGERQVFVSYITEVPVWKSTYRILL